MNSKLSSAPFQNLRTLVLLGIVAFGAVAGLVSCTVSNNDIFRQELAGRGVMALSSDNAYVAANTLLAREMQSSPVIRGFVRTRGTPDAILVTKPVFSGYQLVFFYLSENQRYLLEQAGDAWIISSPGEIPFSERADLNGVKPTKGQAPLIFTAAPEAPGTASAPPLPVSPVKEEGLHGELEKPAAPLTLDLPPVEKVVQKKSEESIAPKLKKKSELKPLPPRAKPVAMPEKKVVEAAPMAGEATKETKSDENGGDVIHQVRFKGETLRIISEHFTGDPENAVRISRINELKNANLLDIGQSVRIPRYLLKTNAPLTQESVQRKLMELGGFPATPAVEGKPTGEKLKEEKLPPSVEELLK